MKVRALKLGAVAALTMAMGITALPAHAAESSSTKQVVTENDVTRQAEDTPPTNNWVLYTRDGTPSTAAEFVDGPATPPLGTGSLQLTTTSGSEKVALFNYDHVGTALPAVNDVSYSTYRQTGADQQVASLNLQVDFNGPNVAGGFTTLVFEPVYNTTQGPVVSGAWQNWTGTGGGVWWSTRTINNQPGGAAVADMRTWDQIVASNPDATILGGVGINQGSGNAGLTDNVDAFTFDNTTYDFEHDVPAPTDKDQCKKDGYEGFNSPSFKNQGQCVSYVAAHKS